MVRNFTPWGSHFRQLHCKYLKNNNTLLVYEVLYHLVKLIAIYIRWFPDKKIFYGFIIFVGNPYLVHLIR